MAAPPDRLPQNIPEHMKLQLDLIVLAFRMNKTRIATLMLNNDQSEMNFGFIDGVAGGLHNDLTHNGRDPKLEAMALRVNAGHGGGLETGRVLDYLDRGDDNRRFCSLHLSLMNRMGLAIDKFGDADRVLADL
jgi:hypothetical protein